MPDYQAYNVLLCSRCRYFVMDVGRHKRDLGMGHGWAYIGNCSAWGQDVRMGPDGGCKREMTCPHYRIGELKRRNV